MRRVIVTALVVLASGPVSAAESCATLDSKAVAAMFDEWNFALSSLEPSRVVQRYWPDAVLLPTVSNTPRTSAAMIGDYFEHFLAKRPRGRIDTRTITAGCNVAMDVGTYTFSLMDDKGVTTEVAARYTFVYQYRDGGWKILHHHSSAMPEGRANAAPEPQHVAHPAAPPPPADERPKSRAKQSRKTEQAAALAPAPSAKVAPPAKVESTPPSEPVVKPEDAPVKETRTAMFANLASSPSPSKFYPPESAKRKEHGNVNLRVCADDSGTVSGAPEVVKSSGSKHLDEAAMSWARAAKWVPATLNRRRVEGCTQVDVSFEAPV